MKKFDAIIIGSGTAGAKIATAFSKQNKTVALIEKDRDILGGSCINTACIPTKTLIHDSLNGVSYSEAIQRKNKLTKKMRENKYQDLHDTSGITIFNGTASFKANKEIEVDTSDSQDMLTAEQIIINTGAVNNIPPIENIEKLEKVYTSTTLINREELPEKLIIIGGGNIGLEYATMYVNFGSDVTVVVDDDKLLPMEEPVISEEIQKVLEEKGVTFLFQAKAERVQEDKDEILVSLSDNRQLKGDAILVATGRKPNIEHLELEQTEIVLTEEDAIKVDEKLQTTVAGVWAVGDVRGGMQFTYISHDDARIIIDQLFGNKTYSMEKRKNVQYTLFTDPPLSRVGYTKEAAEQEGFDVITSEMPVNAIPAAHVKNDTRGLFTSVVDKKTGRILGVSLFGPNSEEIINIVKIAIDEKWTYIDMRDYVFNHPVMSESLNNLFDMEISE